MVSCSFPGGWLAVSIVATTFAPLSQSVAASSLAEHERAGLERTVAYLRENEGLAARNGIRVGVSTATVTKLLSVLTPASFPIPNDLGTIEIMQASAAFLDGLPRLAIVAEAALMGGTIRIPAVIDAVATFTPTQDGDVVLGIDVLDVKLDLGRLAAVPGASALAEQLAAASLVGVVKPLAVTIPLGRTASIALPKLNGPVAFNVGQAQVTMTLTADPRVPAVQVRINQIIVLSDGIHVFAQVE